MVKISKKKAAAWITTATFLPVVLAYLGATVYITIWYAITHYQGGVPATIIFSATNYMNIAAEWITILICILWVRRTVPLLTSFGLDLNRPLTDLILGILFGVILVACYGLGQVVPFEKMFYFDKVKLFSIPGSLTAGICEEVLFRGLVFSAVAFAGGRKWQQLLISSVAFGLVHIYWGPVGMFWTFILGLIFGAMRLWRGNILACIVAHTLLNLCIEPALMLQYFGRSQ